MKKIKLLTVALYSISLISVCFANEDTIDIFPLDNYDQNIATWINPSQSDFDKPLLSEAAQENWMATFYKHFFNELSPWSEIYVNSVLHQQTPNDLKSIEQATLAKYNNHDKSNATLGYGENFRAYSDNWINQIQNNINISTWNTFNYEKINRGIAIDNLHARVLPTNDVHFYNYKLAGQGYPFDNLQISSLWAGTPVYIVSETQDHAWLLVITPDYIAWVKSKGIAHVDDGFVTTWQTAAKNKLAAITHTQLSLVDEKNNFLLEVYVGSVFPATTNGDHTQLMIPSADANQNAIIKYAITSNDDAAIMPLTATPHHLSNIMSKLIGRPYGWGGLYFYNDCSAELKSLLTPFGVWLPRHSADQVTIGKMVDMTASTPRERLSYLINHGHRFLTLIYIGGHVVMYIGQYPDPNNPEEKIAMTYQNLWGLSPNPPNRRAIIGQSVLFPMLLEYPEDTSLVSLADKNFFQVSFLDQPPNVAQATQSIKIDLKSMMLPEEDH